MSVIILVYRMQAKNNLRKPSQMLSGSLLMQVQHHLTHFMERRTLNMKATESWKDLPESDADQNQCDDLSKTLE